MGSSSCQQNNTNKLFTPDLRQIHNDEDIIILVELLNSVNVFFIISFYFTKRFAISYNELLNINAIFLMIFISERMRKNCLLFF